MTAVSLPSIKRVIKGWANTNTTRDTARLNRAEAAAAPVYLSSVNGLAETGEIVNIDGTGNRVANAMYGCESVYYVVGVNKVAPDLHAAIERARQVAAPRNAQRLQTKTPCAVDGKCHDCRSEGRICNIMSIIMGKPNGVGHCKVLLVGETLGY